MFGESHYTDLGDYPLGYTEPQEESYSWHETSRYVPPMYKYQFKDYEELACSEVFQKALTQALAHKDREIESLRNEIMKTLQW